MYSYVVTISKATRAPLIKIIYEYTETGKICIRKGRRKNKRKTKETTRETMRLRWEYIRTIVHKENEERRAREGERKWLALHTRLKEKVKRARAGVLIHTLARSRKCMYIYTHITTYTKRKTRRTLECANIRARCRVTASERSSADLFEFINARMRMIDELRAQGKSN